MTFIPNKVRASRVPLVNARPARKIQRRAPLVPLYRNVAWMARAESLTNREWWSIYGPWRDEYPVITRRKAAARTGHTIATAPRAPYAQAAE